MIHCGDRLASDATPVNRFRAASIAIKIVDQGVATMRGHVLAFRRRALIVPSKYSRGY
jgi:hypothetical protein